MIECWRKKGCPFNSNHSPKYMKCRQTNYSIDKCLKDFARDKEVNK